MIRTRVLLTNIAHWEQVAQVHGELFAGIRPASTIVQVTRFIDPEWLVETEVDAVLCMRLGDQLASRSRS